MSNFEISPFPYKDASPAEYEALNQLTNRMRLERLPDDPPTPLDETVKNLQTIPSIADVRFWVAKVPESGGMAAMADIVLLRVDENRHLAQIELFVLPEYRSQGLGSRLMKLIAETAQEDQRRLLMTETVDRIPAGETFMLRIGGQKGMESHTNQLRLSDLDQALLRVWLERGRAQQDEFELGLWEGAYPEEQIQAIAKLMDLANQQPFGELEIEDMHTTPEQIRESETNIFARGSQRWTIYLTDRSSGDFAGYTETVWNPNRPEILRQDMTGIFPQYRNKGLGRWLKAAMLDKVLKERPEVKFVRTGNADSNAAMLKINTELGFKPYMADTLWQVDVQKVIDYLHSRGL